MSINPRPFTKNSPASPSVHRGLFVQYDDLKAIQEGERSVRSVLAYGAGRLYDQPRGSDVIEPLTGWFGPSHNETAQRMTPYNIELAGDMASWSAWGEVKLIDNGTQVQRLEFRLVDPDLGSTQTLYTLYASGGTPSATVENIGSTRQFFHVQGTLGAFFSFSAGTLGRVRLEIESYITNPRTSAGSNGYWNGLLSFGFVGY